jgi:hypothetical protein
VRQPRTRRRHALAIGAVLAVALAACGGSDKVATKRRKPPAIATTTTTIPIPTAPLTGLPDPQGVAAGRSSLGVKIENTPEARPQSGLDVADVVYEEVVEGGITRFWAFFNSAAPDTVGPIRSVRAMDPNVVTPFGGVVTFSGGTPPNVALIRAAPVVTVDENNANDAFFRERTRPAPHNLYGRTGLLYQRGGKPVPPNRQFEYVPEGQAFAGEPVAQFHVNFSQGYDMTYLWDAAAGGWKRFQRTNEPFLAIGSTPTPVQVAPMNVIVQFVTYDGAGEGNLYGAGDAWVFSNGQLVRGRWTRVFPESPTILTDATGSPIRLTPGRTWVELFPTGGVVDVTAGVPASAPTPTTGSSSTGSTTKP